MKKHGFTLAETLITLTIIGVVATMTIPTLMSKYQKHTYVVGLKRSYAQLKHAFQMLPISMNCPAGDYDCAGLYEYNGTSKFDVAKAISKELKTNKFCYRLTYDNCNDLKNHFLTYIPSSDTDGNQTSGMILADGAIFYQQWNTTSVDVNGFKGPNKVGRDIFRFQTIYENNESNGLPVGTVIPHGSKLYAALSGATYHYWNYRPDYYCTTEKVNSYTKTTSSGNPYTVTFCTGRVLEEDAMNY